MGGFELGHIQSGRRKVGGIGKIQSEEDGGLAA